MNGPIAIFWSREQWHRAALGVFGTLFLIATALLAVWWTNDRGFGLRTLPGATLSLTRAVLDHQRVSGYSRGAYTNIVFLHHSTGHNLIEQGGVRERFAAAGYNFWDHGYNQTGLRDPSGRPTGYGYNVPRDNTDPDGWAGIFSQRVFDLPVNTLSGLMQHEVIIFKSCFAPANRIASDGQLHQYRQWYLGMREVTDKYTDKLFIVVTAPPLNPAETNGDEAARARQFANWLKSEEFLGDRENIRTFDLFDYLAESDNAHPEVNTLRLAYRSGADSHPNRLANETLGPVFVDFVLKTVGEFRSR